MEHQIGFGDQEIGGGSKGQQSKTDLDGNRIFRVFTYSGKTSYPLYKDGSDEDLKLFKGKTPQTVAKKVVTEICQMIKKDNPTYFKKHCQPVTSKELNIREKELEKGINDIRNIDKYINWDNYPGFRFDLEDTMNSTSDGKNRIYKYYGERMKLDNPKKYNENKFQIEPNVIPIRKNYTVAQAFLDHLKKSTKAAEREKKNQNLRKSLSRPKKRTRSQSKSKQKSRSKSKQKSRSNSKQKSSSNNKQKNISNNKQNSISNSSTKRSRTK